MDQVLHEREPVGLPTRGALRHADIDDDAGYAGQRNHFKHRRHHRGHESGGGLAQAHRRVVLRTTLPPSATLEALCDGHTRRQPCVQLEPRLVLHPLVALAVPAWGRRPALRQVQQLHVSVDACDAVVQQPLPLLDGLGRGEHRHRCALADGQAPQRRAPDVDCIVPRTVAVLAGRLGRRRDDRRVLRRVAPQIRAHYPFSPPGQGCRRRALRGRGLQGRR
mmetsp:Transcript_16138/g.32707  ORF Transcript_16138/g.32707 Transcript_16138/m.32707 type:complete len:221 (+) Transcript_16138:174-836(+)